jgi:hypothetical protein
MGLGIIPTVGCLGSIAYDLDERNLIGVSKNEQSSELADRDSWNRSVDELPIGRWCSTLK